MKARRADPIMERCLWMWLLAAVLLLLSGCASIGGSSVNRDRLAYSEALAGSWKEQMLLNIVRLRYGDTPMFLDVSSVINSYQIQGQLSFGGGYSQGLTPGVVDGRGWSGTAGAGALYADRPTITYTPLTGDKFTRSLMRPIPPAALFQLALAGFPIDQVFQLTTRAINGVYNRSDRPLGTRAADPEFYALLDTLRRVQLSESIGLRLERRGADETALVALRRQRPNPQIENELRNLRATLGIAPDARELRLVFGDVPRDDRELAVLSRSILEIMIEIAAWIEVPQDDVAQGRTTPNRHTAPDALPRDRPMMLIHSGDGPPADPFVTVRYQGRWFWIDNREMWSKGVFTFMLLLTSLAETGVVPQAPVVTVPAN